MGKLDQWVKRLPSNLKKLQANSGKILILTGFSIWTPLLCTNSQSDTTIVRFSIELEAGVAIMFTIIFGIVVDDTIHFLTRYKICIAEGLDNKMAIRKTLRETGKAIIFTSIILFFGFFNMIFSTNPPTFTVGILISITLLSALVCDLLLLPALINNFMK
ncbi:MAG: MMPL family transporter [Saprospiraceae bacterium]|nr:MMPL family transporter [Saprospiraceae bacterium]